MPQTGGERDVDMKPAQNRNCPLYNTESCAVMNMRKCEACPLTGRVDDADVICGISNDVALFSSLLPENGIARLFESERCTLCKGDNPNAADGYAIYDMAHSEPKRLQKRNFLFTQDKSGFMVPLQFACCKKCRARLLWQEYLPTVGAILGVGVGVLLTLDEPAVMHWRSIGSSLPLLLVAGGLLVGWAAAQLLRFILRRKWTKQSYLNVHNHPVVREMRKKGWFSVFGGKSGKLILTKRRISQGLGTAKSATLSADFNPEPTEAAGTTDEEC